MESTSTPSATARSTAARMSELKHPPDQHTLYAATRARGAMPRATPEALASGTGEPAAVAAVCVPWPSWSRGDLSSTVSLMGPDDAS
nr:unnamed protein product [Digitaria exilis]